MPICEIVKQEIGAYLQYMDVMKGKVKYSHPEYKRMSNNVLGGDRLGGVEASL